MTGLTALEWVKLAIYYASFLYFVAGPAALWMAMRKPGFLRYLSLVFFSIISVLAYARFVEPRILLTVEHDVALEACYPAAGIVRIAVFSDTHEGLFGNAMTMDRIAARVNAAAPDLVLVPGDFVYFLHPDRFEKKFAPFGEIRAPVLSVLGNHDLGLPGPDLSAPLKETLPRHNVRLIENEALTLRHSRFAFDLVGLSDDWGNKQNLDLLKGERMRPRLALTHNPATVRKLKPDMKADLIIGGHTHGGQIYLPYLTCAQTNMCGGRRYGLSDSRESYPRGPKGKVPFEKQPPGYMIFTTSGTGMVGLPMRFRVPPRIDVLNISWRAC